MIKGVWTKELEHEKEEKHKRKQKNTKKEDSDSDDSPDYTGPKKKSITQPDTKTESPSLNEDSFENARPSLTRTSNMHSHSLRYGVIRIT